MPQTGSACEGAVLGSDERTALAGRHAAVPARPPLVRDATASTCPTTIQPVGTAKRATGGSPHDRHQTRTVPPSAAGRAHGPEDGRFRILYMM